jgi:hypothetical protein
MKNYGRAFKLKDEAACWGFVVLYGVGCRQGGGASLMGMVVG